VAKLKWIKRGFYLRTIKKYGPYLHATKKFERIQVSFT
jgi:hypothetical protein